MVGAYSWHAIGDGLECCFRWEMERKIHGIEECERGTQGVADHGHLIRCVSGHGALNTC